MEMAQNGSENGSEGYSEAPESIQMVSDIFRQVACLTDLNRALNVIFSKIRARELKFRDFELCRNDPETS